ncbi:hypothetical protein [Zavarzinia compransoris]|uniref:Flagellin N-terminal domain-containing protein n=1 Tax=Zavarzinia compransoris TaxID=1264899 RepID=A0A317DZC8_9PROT|nr:hypothetical protein [Zavarzinia compransoris]PWR19782.1 hypothetical protein DKG75_15080 [Zavarzinia compransoris]TDP45114.1 hypothetical protein DES42_106336 [Zavarzinia compransoris]
MSFYVGMSAADQRQAVADAMDRTYLLIKQGMATRQAKELQQVTQKYTTQSKLPALQQDIDRLSTQKTTADDAVFAVKGAATAAQEVLLRLNEAFAAAKTGNASAFDTALTRINIMIGSRGVDLDNLIGNTAPGTSGQETRFIDAGATQVSLSLRSLGTQFLLTEQGTGQRMETNFYNQTLRVGGRDVALADLSLVSRSDDTLTFTDGTDSWTADLARGGLPVTSAWTYGGLTGDGQTRAVDDVGAAIRLVTKAFADLSNGQLQAELGTSILQSRLSALGDEATALNDSESDALAAEKKAINTRYQMAMSNLAFAAQAQREVIGVMIADDPVSSSKNQSVFDIMGSAFTSS